jgi:hypothetical protein
MELECALNSIAGILNGHAPQSSQEGRGKKKDNPIGDSNTLKIEADELISSAEAIRPDSNANLPVLAFGARSTVHCG